MKHYLLLLIVFLIASCNKPLPDSDWEKGVEELKDNRLNHISTILKRTEKQVRDGGNKPNDTLLLDSLVLIDTTFHRLYAKLDSKKLFSAKAIQDSINSQIKNLDKYIIELPVEKIASLDSFQFLRLQNKLVRIKEETISDEYTSLYRQSLFLELIELEAILLTKKSERLANDYYNAGTSRFIVVANKDLILEGETYRAKILCITSLVPNDKYIREFIIDGKKYSTDKEGMIDYKILPEVKFGKNEKFKKKCVTISYPVTLWGKDTIMSSEHCYTIQKKCSK